MTGGKKEGEVCVSGDNECIVLIDDDWEWSDSCFIQLYVLYRYY